MRETKVRLLGEFSVEEVGQKHESGTSSESLSLRAKLLLASVAVTSTAVMRSELIARLWPGRDERASSDANLNNCISDARAPLGGARQALRSLRTERALRLIREGTDKKSSEDFCVEVDLDDFRSLIESPSVDDNTRALALVRGQLLHGVEHAWLAEERLRIDRLIVKAIRVVTRWPDERATQVLKDFYAKPQGTLDAAVVRLRADDDEQLEPADPPGDTLLMALRAYYPDATKLATLYSLVVPQKPTYYDMSIRLYLRDTADLDTYELKYQVEFVAPLDEFIVALTTRATLGDLLIAECPQLSEAFAFSSDVARDAFADDAIDLTYYEATATDRVSKRKLNLHRVTAASARKRYLGALPSHVASDIVLLRASVPGASAASRRLETTIVSSDMSRREHYCFWIADRPSFIRRITVDLSRFTVPDGERPHLHPLLGTVGHEVTETDATYDIIVDNWLVKDQGVMLVW